MTLLENLFGGVETQPKRNDLSFFSSKQLKQQEDAATEVVAVTPVDEEQNMISKKLIEITPLIKVQDEILRKIAIRIDQFPKRQTIEKEEEETIFSGPGILQITLIKYVERLVHVANVWAEDVDGPNSTGVRCAIIAIELLERLNLETTERSIHRLFGIAFILGLKFMEDFTISNQFWGKVGGFSLLEANLMEIEFLKRLNWNLTVSEDSYANQRKKFVSSTVSCAC